MVFSDCEGARSEKPNEARRVQEESARAVPGTREADHAEERESQERQRVVRPVCEPGADGGAHSAVLALRFRLPEQSASDGAHWRERRVQRRRDGIRREVSGARACRGSGPEILPCGGGKSERCGQFPVLGLPDRDAGDRRAGHKCIRHPCGAARGWVDLRTILYGAEGSEGAAMGYLFGGGEMRDCTHKRPEEMGTADGSANEIAATKERGVTYGIVDGKYALYTFLSELK